MLKTKRSGGPRSESGKLASSQNAIKTGAYAKTMILPGESREAFIELLEGLRIDFSPGDIVENALVDQMAGLIWKLQRLDYIELGVMKAQLSSPLTYLEWKKLPGDMNESWQWIFDDFENSSSSISTEASAYLTVNQSFEKMPGDKYFLEIQRSFPSLLKMLFTMAESYFMMSSHGDKALHLAALSTKIVDPGDGRPMIQLFKCLQHELKERCLKLRYFKEHLEQIEIVMSSIHSVRLRNALQTPDIQRAHGYLTSALFRVMSELRRQQDWRIRTRTAEVGDAEIPEEEEIPRGRLIEQVNDQKTD